MKQLLLLLTACLVLAACGKKAELEVPPPPGEMQDESE
ncbi:LPS translocon maturation chaperone LptM [Aquisalinus flavus]